MNIMAAWLSKTEVMMGMPFADMVQTEMLFKQFSKSEQVVHILIEEGGLVVCLGTGADGIHDYRDTIFCPISEKLPTSLDVRIVQDAS